MSKTTLEDYLYRNLTNQTAKSYQYHIGIFLQQNPLAINYNYIDIVNYINTLKDNNKGISLNVRIAAIKKYYDYLIELSIRDDHPCRNIRIKKKKQYIQLQDLFSVEELELLLSRENRYSNLESRNKLLITFLIYQGLTSAELTKIRLNDVNLEEGTIYIRSSKTLSSRVLNLKAKQIRLIESYVDESRMNLLGSSSSEYLFITIRGVQETVDGIHSMIEPLKGLFPGRKLNPSVIRQSVISNLLNVHKKPIEDVQLFAGHKFPSTTQRYVRKDIEVEREKINMWHPLG